MIDRRESLLPFAAMAAMMVATAAMAAAKGGTLAYWGPKLKEYAATALIVPEALRGDTLTVDGEVLKIVGLDGPTPDRTFVWTPAARTVLGGTLIVADEHVFMADTIAPVARRLADNVGAGRSSEVGDRRPRSLPPEPRRDRTALPGLRPVHPRLSGRFRAGSRPECRLGGANAAGKFRYPALAGAPLLETGAKVIKREMKWPAE